MAGTKPGHDEQRGPLICPSGALSTGLSSLISDFPKNISVPTHPKSLLELWPSHPTRGAYRDRHGRGAGCGGRGSVLRATGSQGGFLGTCERSTARGREMLLRTAKSCGPDAPTLASSFAEVKSARPGLDKAISADDGGKRARSPGRARRKRVPWKGTVLERVQVPPGKGRSSR